MASQLLGNYEEDVRQVRRRQKLRKLSGKEARPKPATRRKVTTGKKRAFTGGGKRRISKSPSPTDCGDEDNGDRNPFYNVTFLNYMLKHV
jgi:hypothetical protein